MWAASVGVWVALGAAIPLACADPTEPYDDDDDIGWSEGTSVRPEANRDSWVGSEGTRQVFALYSGVTWAPFTNLRQDGLRLRLVGAQSYYRYTGLRFDATTADNRLVAFRGAASTVDLLAGWQWSAGQLTTKMFAGLRLSDHRISPFDPDTLLQGKVEGAVGAIEAWYNVTERLWTSLDLYVSTPHRAYSHKLRVGWRTAPTWSLGLEGQAVGHIENRALKAGAFVRFDDGVHEVMGSAGMASPDGGRSTPYATVQWLRRF